MFKFRRRELRDGLGLQAFVICTLVLFNSSVYLNELGESIPLIQPITAVLVVSFLGGLTLMNMGIKPRLHPKWFIYTVATSLMLIIGIGFIMNIASLILGYGNPISTLTLTFAVNVTVLMLLFRAHTNGRLRESDFTNLVSIEHVGPQALFFALLPPCSVLAVAYLNRTNDPVPLLVVLVLIATIPLLVTLLWFDDRYFAFGIFCTGLAVLYHKSLWLGQFFGGHSAVVEISKKNIWLPSGESILSNAILVPSLTHLSGVSAITFTKVVLPIIVAFIPVAMYSIFKTYTTPKTAVLGSFLFIFAHPFYFQYPSTPRASIPVLFLVLLGVAIADDETTEYQRRLLAIVAGVGIVISHYGTSYYVMFVMVGAIPLLLIYALVDRVIARNQTATGPVMEEDVENTPEDKEDFNPLTWVFSVFYLSAVFGWYSFVSGGTKLSNLAARISVAYSDFFTGGGGSSPTVNKFTTEYGGLSIVHSRYLYLSIATLIGGGFLVIYARRFLMQKEAKMSDSYIALSSMLFGVFILSTGASSAWGGGRPLMVLLSLCAIYAVIGIVFIGRIFHRAYTFTTTNRWLSGVADKTIPPSLIGRSTFAILLAAFFVLNSGVMATVEYGGDAPSNVPNTDVDTIHWQADAHAHAWVAENKIHEEGIHGRDPGDRIYGDQLAYAQATDWLNGEISARSERGSYRFRASQSLQVVDRNEFQRGYMVLTGLNTIDGMVKVNHVTFRPISEYDLHRAQRNKLYTNDKGEIYYSDNVTVNIHINNQSDDQDDILSKT